MKLQKRSFRKSLFYALRGIGIAVKYERHMKFHLLLAILVFFIGYFFKISSSEWLFLSLSISLVLFSELMNTALEANVDLVTEEIKYKAMVAKDVAAGAVLVASLNALFVGIFIFYKYIAILFSFNH